ncbi:MAG: hypothetical protein A2V83_07700 [Nitrospirae bacterium RBG_16_64_22]|nr:MAG: hypothetical protein A2V83_07700 [Nitrospirae bacterium RBG_16_64_22]
MNVRARIPHSKHILRIWLDIMTNDDYLVVMKNVRIANLKANLSRHLRDVRRGHPLVVMDRETPIARLVPYAGEGEPLIVRHPRRKYLSLQQVPLPAPLGLDIDIVPLLLEERQGEK